MKSSSSPSGGRKLLLWKLSAVAFISDDRTRDDKKQSISIIHTSDKYNTLRLQETSGGSYHFSTDSLIEKLQALEKKYPFHFIGVGDDWLLLKTNDTPKYWTDFAKEVLKVCPPEDEVNIDEYATAIKNAQGRVSMGWDYGGVQQPVWQKTG